MHTEVSRRHRSELLYLVALIAFLCHGGDVVMLHGPSLPAFLARLSWGACLALLAWASRRVSVARFEWIVAAAGLISVAGWISLTWITGGSASPYFHWMSALPLIVGALAPGLVRAVSAVGLVTILANTGLLAAEGAPGDAYAMWISFSSTTSALAVFGSMTALRVRDGERRAEEARARAVAELAESEKRRLHAEKLALMGTLASGVAHEINNPLAFVASSLALLRENPAAVQETVAECELAIGRITEIIDTMRSFARVDDAAVGPCDLREVVHEALLLASVSLREVARVVWEPPAGLPAVAANHGQLVQVLVNLLVNAADAVAETGRSGVVRIEARRSDGGVVVEVVDDGIGLRAGVEERIFEPFFTTKPAGKGTGLGLTLSREYLLRFHALLDGAGEPGGGARFCVRLQAA